MRGGGALDGPRTFLAASLRWSGRGTQAWYPNPCPVPPLSPSQLVVASVVIGLCHLEASRATFDPPTVVPGAGGWNLLFQFWKALCWSVTRQAHSPAALLGGQK